MDIENEFVEIENIVYEKEWLREQISDLKIEVIKLLERSYNSDYAKCSKELITYIYENINPGAICQDGIEQILREHFA